MTARVNHGIDRRILQDVVALVNTEWRQYLYRASPNIRFLLCLAAQTVRNHYAAV